MLLLELLKRLLFGSSAVSSKKRVVETASSRSDGRFSPPAEASVAVADKPRKKPREEQTWPILRPLRRKKVRPERDAAANAGSKQYPFAYPYVVSDGSYLDLTKDTDRERLDRWDLPYFETPTQLAEWFNLPLGQLAWLTDRFSDGKRPVDKSKAHYRYQWRTKRSGGYRLIEAPLPLMRQVQEQILDEILDRVPTHDAAHGFCAGRSVVTNAEPHVGQAVVVKFDLDNFYTRVRYSRVVAVFRSFGYSREVAIWLARLSTSAIPANLDFPGRQPKRLRLFLPRHLPQGAPTSPCMANLVAFSLDVRLSGLAKSFGATYTRYGDDLTFSGDESYLRSLRVFIPLAHQIIRQERFVLNGKKKQIRRRVSQQKVTGVVVNDKTNIPRKEFDRLKATLHNCVQHGPDSQNHDQHPNFRAHLRGRIAYVQQLNEHRGNKLLSLYQAINWS
ncbi:reverse transcriptase family protein [Rubinisphaera margarita]|uniref:reverse transcriptase family protein n=1 Tax=Rubinisphaera margarita TaxID=2909586 RepID=UPI001EE815DB|nr:reverse transcriptase family protein [Rubinisphaera margarita]MCG6155483.1 reverse transcriptase family protein [Rubinisphaera margarita]